jgi:hypothetical protein
VHRDYPTGKILCLRWQGHDPEQQYQPSPAPREYAPFRDPPFLGHDLPRVIRALRHTKSIANAGAAGRGGV